MPNIGPIHIGKKIEPPPPPPIEPPNMGALFPNGEKVIAKASIAPLALAAMFQKVYPCLKVAVVNQELVILSDRPLLEPAFRQLKGEWLNLLNVVG